jgi:hypothetical protein
VLSRDSVDEYVAYVQHRLAEHRVKPKLGKRIYHAVRFENSLFVVRTVRLIPIPSDSSAMLNVWSVVWNPKFTYRTVHIAIT